MEYSRRQILSAVGAIGIGAALGGWQTLPDEKTAYESNNRIYTSGYDALVFAIGDGVRPKTAWVEWRLAGQTRDVLPMPDGNVLAVDDYGLTKFRQGLESITQTWRYRGIDGSVRGITADTAGGYYVGSWTPGQGFHKVVERDDAVETAWVYDWPDDNGMITAAADPDGRLAIATKSGDVHLIEERDSEPVKRWQWSPGNDEIIREVLWDGRGHLYVASEDHHLYKLQVGSSGPEMGWEYDAGNMIFGASVTPQDAIYVATNAGEIHSLRDVDGSPERQWRYQHTEYEGEAPTGEYFWDGLAHQVAARPDPDEECLYSCAYGENTVHRIDIVDGEPVKRWEFGGHTDNVREVRIHGEYVGITPELWEQYR